MARWMNSKRKARFNPDWPRTRKLILQRDDYRCQWPVTDDFGVTKPCGRMANEVDHKVRARNGEPDDDSPSNLWALCDWHHSQKTAQESAEQRRENRARRKETEWYSHPAYRRTSV